MNETSFRFKIGAYDCIALCDGSLASRWSTIFGNVPGEELEQLLTARGLPSGQMISPSACLVIDTGQHRVLVDTGRGTGLAPSGSNAGMLLQRLHQQRIHPSDIDRVILSHLHSGHAGGAMAGSGQLTFHLADHVLWREEWEFWQAVPDLRTRNLQRIVTFAQEVMRAVQGQSVFVERDAEIVPGIQVVAAPGHSAGHMGLAIASNGQQLLYLADAVFHPLHLEYPLWFSPFDLRPEQSVTSRLRLLDRAAAEKTLVHAPHFPFPGLGYVIPHGEFWRWQPLQTG